MERLHHVFDKFSKWEVAIVRVLIFLFFLLGVVAIFLCLWRDFSSYFH